MKDKLHMTTQLTLVPKKASLSVWHTNILPLFILMMIDAQYMYVLVSTYTGIQLVVAGKFQLRTVYPFLCILDMDNAMNY